ncbi:MAG: hypothetical protein ACYTFY_10950 [Planctomycetota bacterium]|jgi:hypothetical protein
MKYLVICFSFLISIILLQQKLSAEDNQRAPLPNDAKGLLMRFQDKNNKREDHIQICEKLLPLEDEAAKEIHKLYLAVKLKYKGMFLIETLMKINTPAAMQAMKTVLGYSFVVPSDIKDPEAVVKKLAAGRKAEKPSSAVEWFAKQLPPDIDSALKSIAEKDEKLPAAVLRRITALSFNRILRGRKIYNAAFFNTETMNAEMKDYAERFKYTKEARLRAGLAPIELYRFNRMLIDSLFPGLIRPGAKNSAAKYFRSHSEFSLELLTRSNTDTAREIIAYYHPIGFTDQMNHIRALQVVETYEASQKLAEYLESKERSVSSIALRILLKRLKNDDSNIADFADKALERIKWEKAGKYPDFIYRNILNLCAAVPDEGAGLLAGALKSSNKSVKKHALLMLTKKPTLARKDNVWRALYEALPDWEEVRANGYKHVLDKKQIVNLIDALGKRRIKEVTPVIVYCLDSSFYDVRIKACDILTIFTGQKFDRNPVKWKEWFKNQK